MTPVDRSSASPAGGRRLLVIDDEPGVREALAGLFELVGYEVSEAGSAAAALALAREGVFDVALIDVHLGETSGLDLLPGLRALQPTAALIVLTAIATIEVAVEAMRRGADDFVTKPLDPPRLLSVVASHRERRAPRPRRGRRMRVSPERDAAGHHEPLFGRERERATLEGALDRGGPCLVYLHGPGGIGKTALLQRFVRHCRERRARVTELDGATLERDPGSLPRALGRSRWALGRSRWAGVTRRRQVLVIDDYRPSEGGDDRLARELTRTGSRGTVVVLAGRQAPSARWSGPTFVSLRLDPLGDGDAHALLRARGLPTSSLEAAARFAHGHPLTLTLVADALARDPAAAPQWSPELVQAIARHVVGEVVEPFARVALEVAAVVRRVDEGVLAALVPDADPRALFDGLASRPFMRPVASGLAIDELARAVVAADLRWRAPERYGALVLAATDEVGARLARGTHADLALDLLFLLRSWLGLVGAHGEALHARPATSADRAAIVGLVAEREGPEAAALASTWLERGIEAWVARADDGELVGVLGCIALERARPSEIQGDPVARAAWRHAKRSWRQGEQVNLVRWCLVDARHREASRAALGVAAVALRKHIGAPLAMSLWPTTERLDDPIVGALLHVQDADFEWAGRRHALLAVDLRRQPISSWLADVARRMVGLASPPRPPDAPIAPAPLTRAEFQRAVRTALKHLHEPDRLADNPLARARLVNDSVLRDATPAARAATLRGLIAEAVAELAALPRKAGLHAALHHTYVVPATKQEVAAELAGVSFASYRRHLLRATELVAARLWERETGNPERVGTFPTAPPSSRVTDGPLSPSRDLEELELEPDVLREARKLELFELEAVARHGERDLAAIGAVVCEDGVLDLQIGAELGEHRVPLGLERASLLSCRPADLRLSDLRFAGLHLLVAERQERFAAREHRDRELHLVEYERSPLGVDRLRELLRELEAERARVLLLRRAGIGLRAAALPRCVADLLGGSAAQGEEG